MENNNLIVLDIKKNFDYIKDLRSNINDIFVEIKEKLNALENIYIEILNKHKNMDYTFGIDSFYFQNKLIEIEYDNTKCIFNGITNRIYCEYYKLYKMIYTYITTEVKDPVLIEKLNQKKNYPVYKDLEPLKTYNFDLIIDIQGNIIETIELLFNYLSNKESELNYVSTTSDFGINIEHLINYKGYSNTLLNEKINIFCKYLSIFNKHHNKYFSRLLIKSKLMIGIVNEDIQLKKGNKITNVEVNREVNMQTAVDINEETKIKEFINYEIFDSNLQSEFNSIISNSSPPNISISPPPSISISQSISSQSNIPQSIKRHKSCSLQKS
jgi:hypothetical protein